MALCPPVRDHHKNLSYIPSPRVSTNSKRRKEKAQIRLKLCLFQQKIQTYACRLFIIAMKYTHLSIAVLLGQPRRNLLSEALESVHIPRIDLAAQ